MAASRADVPVIPVIFRVWKPRPELGEAGGDLIALFPTIPGDRQGIKVASYDNEGHAEVHYHDIVGATRPARPADYARMLQRIRSPGWFGAVGAESSRRYKVEVFDRASREMHAACLAEARDKAIHTRYAPAAWRSTGGGGANMVASMPCYAAGGGGASPSAAARRHGLTSYYSLLIPWEPNPAKRTEWHPTESKGPFSKLSRGAFSTVEKARAWAKKYLGHGATYSIRKH